MLIGVWRKEKAVRFGVARKMIPFWTTDSSSIRRKRNHIQEGPEVATGKVCLWALASLMW